MTEMRLGKETVSGVRLTTSTTKTEKDVRMSNEAALSNRFLMTVQAVMLASLEPLCCLEARVSLTRAILNNPRNPGTDVNCPWYSGTSMISMDLDIRSLSVASSLQSRRVVSEPDAPHPSQAPALLVQLHELEVRLEARRPTGPVALAYLCPELAPFYSYPEAYVMQIVTAFKQTLCKQAQVQNGQPKCLCVWRFGSRPSPSLV